VMIMAPQVSNVHFMISGKMKKFEGKLSEKGEEWEQVGDEKEGKLYSWSQCGKFKS
jgi:hypothetical protein